MRRFALVVAAALTVGALLVRPLITRHRTMAAGRPAVAAGRAQSAERSRSDDVRIVERFVRVAPAPELRPQPASAHPASARRPATHIAPGQERRSALARLFFGDGAYRPRPFPRPGDAQRPTDR